MLILLDFDFFHQSLASRLSQSLNISQGHCVAALNELQTNAIDKLRARDLFRESGKFSDDVSNSILIIIMNVSC